MLQESRNFNATHFIKPYYEDEYGSRSIGEPDWRPHPRNALSDPNAVPCTKTGGGGQDWYSELRCPPVLPPIQPRIIPQTTRDTITTTIQPRISPQTTRDNITTTIQPRISPQTTRDTITISKSEEERHSTPSLSRKNSVVALKPVDYPDEDERYIYRRTFELTINKAMGEKKQVHCLRNGLPERALGDKYYKVPEYSREFHKYGSTLPTVSFGGAMKCIPDTFIPLQDLPIKPRPTFKSKMRKIEKAQEIQEVVTLDFWKPAPMLVPSLQLPPSVSHF